MKKFLSILLVTILSVSLLAACSSKGASNQSADSSKKEFSPKRDIEIVVPYSAGGGSDVIARVLAKVIKDKNLVDQNVLVVNKPGGSGAIGNTYTYSKQGDPHTLMTWAPGQQAGTIINDAEVRLEDLTPIATMALDSFLVAVAADSKYDSFEALVKAAKENPNQVTVGGSGIGNEDHLLFHLINKHYGTKLKYVTFKSGGETTAALLGGHVDVVITNPNEIMAQIKAGKVKALATSSEERLGKPLDQVPTFTELGQPEVQVVMFRGFVGPPEMPEEAVKYWEGVLKKVSESKAWQEDYINKFNLDSVYKGSEESEKFFKDVLDQYLELHREIGTLK
ncbi:Bug family tripartite tricarboxylate transporter substrate binding protein [Pseudalkalibacillus decolorationis]|uniref:Bug family tripartite tricarboxylate transporter substrate binding protein n=1 Tax=Pseudalkalibacillus decolorationis TaxID=163879 RepID=UPI0021498770|nr:tripartite tricarboxylate transporter substrate binding protein [Pseudalkalibacillus decolorationis]